MRDRAGIGIHFRKYAKVILPIRLFVFFKKGDWVMGTAERRPKIIKQICLKRRVTMPNLADEFNVSVRTISRDIDEVSDIIPIRCQKGRYEGGVYLDKDFCPDRMYMSKEELEFLQKIKSSLCEEDKEELNTIINKYTKPKTS